jgi:hypothetical protein
MKDCSTLQAKRINYGQSLIWLEAEGKELTRPRTIATNEVDNVTRRHCPKEVFEGFYTQFHTGLDNVASLSTENLEAIAADLKLEA